MGNTFAKSHVIQNVFAGHDVLKRCHGYSNQTTDSTHFSEEFLKTLKNPLARPSILSGIMISRIEESKIIFSFSQREKCKCKPIISLCEKTFIQKFFGRAKNFLHTWCPGSDTFCSSGWYRVNVVLFKDSRL